MLTLPSASQDRFEEITRYLHFTTMTSCRLMGKTVTRLQKVDPILSVLKDHFQSAYYPNCQLSVDEAMIPFNGQSSMKQYIPLKPVKHTFKVWVTANALNGYLYNFNVCTGATGDRTRCGQTSYWRTWGS